MGEHGEQFLSFLENKDEMPLGMDLGHLEFAILRSVVSQVQLDRRKVVDASLAGALALVEKLATRTGGDSPAEDLNKILSKCRELNDAGESSYNFREETRNEMHETMDAMFHAADPREGEELHKHAEELREAIEDAVSKENELYGELDRQLSELNSWKDELDRMGLVPPYQQTNDSVDTRCGYRCHEQLIMEKYHEHLVNEETNERRSIIARASLACRLIADYFRKSIATNALPADTYQKLLSGDAAVLEAIGNLDKPKDEPKVDPKDEPKEDKSNCGWIIPIVLLSLLSASLLGVIAFMALKPTAEQEEWSETEEEDVVDV